MRDDLSGPMATAENVVPRTGGPAPRTDADRAAAMRVEAFKSGDQDKAQRMLDNVNAREDVQRDMVGESAQRVGAVPAALDDLIRQRVEAQQRGDRAAVSSLTSRIDPMLTALDAGRYDGQSLGSPPDVIAVPATSAEIAAANALPGGPALVAQWGGATSENFRENLGYARQEFAAAVAELGPEVVRLADAFFNAGHGVKVMNYLANRGRQRTNLMGGRR